MVIPRPPRPSRQPSEDPLVRQLIQRRVSRNLRQRDVAALMGTTPGAISKYESGSIVPWPKRLRAWANVLGLELTLVPMPMPGTPESVAVQLRADFGVEALRKFTSHALEDAIWDAETATLAALDANARAVFVSAVDKELFG